MFVFDKFKVLEEVEKGLGDGDLTLIICCYKCHTKYELNPESVVMAIGLNTPFIEYLRWIQSSKCPNCNKKKD
ncbi:MAG TPA: hypothetical protein VGK47_14770 [Nitrososphaeraceae archaeon]